MSFVEQPVRLQPSNSYTSLIYSLFTGAHHYPAVHRDSVLYSRRERVYLTMGFAFALCCQLRGPNVDDYSQLHFSDLSKTKGVVVWFRGGLMHHIQFVFVW